jgi:hypothetical protein
VFLGEAHARNEVAFDAAGFLPGDLLREPQ